MCSRTRSDASKQMIMPPKCSVKFANAGRLTRRLIVALWLSWLQALYGDEQSKDIVRVRLLTDLRSTLIGDPFTTTREMYPL